MDLQLSELRSLTLTDVLRQAITIPQSAPYTFALITLVFVLPLSFANLAHTLITHSIVYTGFTSVRELALLLNYHLAYLLILYTFYILSTAAVVFTVASLYAAKPVSFFSTLSAIHSIFPRLLRTFVWFSFPLLLYNLPIPLLLFMAPYLPNSAAIYFFLGVLTLTFLAVHTIFSSWWHMASVVSVIEPVYGRGALVKSRHLLRCRLLMAAAFIIGYLGICGMIGFAFREMVMKGRWGIGVGVRILVGSTLVVLQVVVNLSGLLVQSMFYFVCKSCHCEMIDKNKLYDRLGGYLGEYVLPSSTVEMEVL